MFIFNSFAIRRTRGLKTGLALVATTVALALSSQIAQASSGCDFLNAGNANITSTNTGPFINTIGSSQSFDPGETVIVTLNGTITNSFAQVGTQNIFSGATGGTNSIVIVGGGPLFVESDIATIGGTGSIGWTCTPVGGPPVMAPVVAPVVAPNNNAVLEAARLERERKAAVANILQGNAEHTTRQHGALIGNFANGGLPIPESFDDSDNLLGTDILIDNGAQTVVDPLREANRLKGVIATDQKNLDGLLKKEKTTQQLIKILNDEAVDLKNAEDSPAVIRKRRETAQLLEAANKVLKRDRAIIADYRKKIAANEAKLKQVEVILAPVRDAERDVEKDRITLEYYQSREKKQATAAQANVEGALKTDDADQKRSFAAQAKAEFEELRKTRRSIEAARKRLMKSEALLKKAKSEVRKKPGPAKKPVTSSYISDDPTKATNSLSRFNLSGSKFGLVGSARTIAVDGPVPVIIFAKGSVSFLNGEGDGEIGLGQLGVAAKVKKNIVIGAYALGVVGSTKRAVSTTSTDTDTKGFGGGIYSRYILGNRIAGSIGLNYVKTDNDVTVATVGQPNATGSFDGHIFTANGSFSRTFDVDGLLITPSIGATYISRRTSAYSDTNGISVASTSRKEWSGDLGILLTRSFLMNDNSVAVITPWISANTRINISDNGGTFTAGRLVFEQDDARYSLGLGVNVGFVNGMKLNLNSSFNDLGADTESITIGAKLIIPLQ